MASNLISGAIFLTLLATGIQLPGSGENVLAPVQNEEGAAPADNESEKPFASDSAANAESAAPLFKYVGNSFSNKFHRPSCKFAKCISPGHLTIFARRHNATDAGFAPCRWCLPPSWKTVHAVLLNANHIKTVSEPASASLTAGAGQGTIVPGAPDVQPAGSAEVIDHGPETTNEEFK